MKNIANENENVPAVFKEEIVVEEHSDLPTEGYLEETEESSKPRELKRQGTGSSDEYIPEITGVEFDAFLIEKHPEPEIYTEFESKIEPHAANISLDERVQFERQGYFKLLTKSNTFEFHRVVNLKDTWKK